MGTYQAKNATSHPITLSNLMGGECLVGTPESIPDACVQRAYNWEYGGEVLQPQVVPGVVTQLDLTEEATAGFYDKVHDIYLVVSGQELYTVTTNFATKTHIGTLTGTYRPAFCLYDTYALIASGGQVQEYDGSTLATTTGSPNSHHVSVVSGRVRAYNIFSDVVNYSAIGDRIGWTNNPSDISSAQFIDVGYKDAGVITATMRLSQDFIVIKSSGTPYRIVNENNFNSVAVIAAADNVYAYNYNCGLSVGNVAYFCGSDGIQSFTTTDSYGAVKVDYPAPGYFINPWFVLNSDVGAHMWHVPSKRQIWVKGQSDKLVYMYHYNVTVNGIAGSWTRRTFAYQINDVMINENNVYVLYGNKIGKIDETIDTDDGNNFDYLLITKRHIPTLKKYILEYFNYMTVNFVPGNANLELSTKSYPYMFSSTDSDIFGDESEIYGDESPIVSDKYTRIRKNLQKRLDYLEARISGSSGRLAVQTLVTNVSEVNF
jgi:hypothetical protein